MRTADQVLDDLKRLFEHEVQLEATDPHKLSMSPALRDELDAAADTYRRRVRRLTRRTLEEFARFPPQHLRHLDRLDDFHAVSRFDQSVFVMTKYPDGDGPLDAQLTDVIKAVKDAIRECGLTPRVAKEGIYHPMLWDNVEIHLLGCSMGVAIVEDRYKPELNPNVAMEWGWMRGMGRPVLYLVEQEFKHFRADWEGLQRGSFSWSDPRTTVQQAIKAHLPLIARQIAGGLVD